MILLNIKIFVKHFIILSGLAHSVNCFVFDIRSTNQIGEKQDYVNVLNEILAFTGILREQDQDIEDVSLNITQLVKKYCCPIKEYQIYTIDGYRLTMFRIQSQGPPVFLMHGLFNSADDWVTAGPDSALAYILATAGYDVWIGNARGTKYSRQHFYLSPEEPQFWEFSWDEIGRYDLPAMINYVLKTTNKSQLTYIGHSQGTTAFFVLCSELPEYNEKISLMIALSPVAWMAHIKSSLVKLVAPYLIQGSWIFKLFNFYELMPNKKTLTWLCNIGNGIVCLTGIFTICGFDYELVNKTNTQVILGHLPGGGSLNQVLHFLQSVVSKSFQRYDHGPETNELIYGSTTPPRYPVENIKAPVALIYGDNDWISVKADILILKHRLQNVTSFLRVPFRKFNHLDFMFAKEVKCLVYNKVLQLLQNRLEFNKR